MKKLLKTILTLLLACSCFSAYTEPHYGDKIAVIFSSEGLPKHLARQLENIAFNRLRERGYQTISRSDIKVILREIDFQSSILTEDNAVRTGKILNAKSVFIGTGFGIEGIDPLSKESYSGFSVESRIVDVGTLEVVWSDYYEDVKTVDRTALRYTLRSPKLDGTILKHRLFSSIPILEQSIKVPVVNEEEYQKAREKYMREKAQG